MARQSKQTKRENGSGSIRQLPSGKYQAQYTAPDGRRRSLGTFPTETAAKAALRRNEGKIELGQWHAPAGKEKPQTVADYYRHFVTIGKTPTGKPWKPSNKRNHERVLADYVTRDLPTDSGPLNLGNLPLAKVTPQLIDAWQVAVLTDSRNRAAAKASKPLPDGYGYGAAASAYKHVRAVFAHAESRRVIDRSPCTTKGAASNPYRRKAPAVTWDMAPRILEHLKERYHAAVIISLWGNGARTGELLALRRSDIMITRNNDGDVTGGQLTINRAVWFNDDGSFVYGEPKTSESERTTELAADVARVVANHLDRFTGQAADALLFTAELTGKQLDRHTLGRAFKRAAVRAGYPDVSLHRLRNGIVTELDARGVPLTRIAEMVGHSNIATTQKYLRRKAGTQRQALDAIASGFKLNPSDTEAD